MEKISKTEDDLNYIRVIIRKLLGTEPIVSIDDIVAKFKETRIPPIYHDGMKEAIINYLSDEFEIDDEEWVISKKDK